MRQQKFAEFYAQSGNAVQSAVKAGYKGYPLLSEAIAQGIYYPRCEDVHTYIL